MVVTLWTSSKARNVIETGINLSRQGEGHEKSRPNTLSRIVVRVSMSFNTVIGYILPKNTIQFIDREISKTCD